MSTTTSTPSGLHRPRVPLGARLRLHGRSRLAWLAACLGIAVAWTTVRSGPVVATDVDAALRSYLAASGYLLEEGEPLWLEPEQGPLGLRAVVFAAHREGELRDVYYAEVRAGRRSVHGVWWLTNLTRSSSAAEGDLVQLGRHVAFAVRVGERADAVVVLDTHGEPAQLTAGWPLYARAQNAITNLQESSRLHGMGRSYLRFVQPPAELTLAAEAGRFVARADGQPLVLRPGAQSPEQGAQLVEASVEQKGRPGTITWVVDTVRNLSFVGPRPIEWLEHVVFGLQDRAMRAYHDMVGVDAESAANMQAALAAPDAPTQEAVQAAEALLDAAGPELGFPPARLSPLLPEPVRGEGEWRPLVDDAFVAAYPNAPPAFYQTFLRVDAERPYVSVYVTLWDPRQLRLHIVMGTKEPESATGETGTGLIPRDPELLKRLVGGFNGGFQAMHGEFGMMAEGRVYLPPKPWAATVGVYDDGRVAIGSWRGPGKTGWDEARANAQIPAGMIAMRQNLTSVVEDGKYNPWKRWWWGAAPEAAAEQTFIARSGLCLTEEGHLAYLWGDSMGPDQLGAAMLALRCVRGIHLDMNSKHTGFELYRPLPPGTAHEHLDRPLTEQQYEGPISGAPGFTLRSRLAVKLMAPLRFPRYVERDPRDYFFLTQRPVLPGPDADIAGRTLAFSTEGLPHHGWPHAFARAQVAERTWLLRVDGSRAIPQPLAPPELTTTLAVLVGAGTSSDATPATAGGQLALFATETAAGRRFRIDAPKDGAQVLLRGPDLERRPPATRALGVDADGFLLYAETEGPAAEGALGSLLREAGVTRAIALPDDAALGFVRGDVLVSVDGTRARPRAPGLGLVAETRPSAEVLFPEIAPLPYTRWGFLQGQRVRYFPTHPPRFRAPEDVLGKRPAPVGDAGVAAPAPPTQ